MDIDEEINLIDFLTGNNFQLYLRIIFEAKFLPHHANNLSFIKETDGSGMKTRMLCTLNLDNGTLFSAWIEQRPLLVHVASDYVQNLMKH